MVTATVGDSVGLRFPPLCVCPLSFHPFAAPVLLAFSFLFLNFVNCYLDRLLITALPLQARLCRGVAYAELREFDPALADFAAILAVVPRSRLR